jgi:ribosomal protein S12 methylthiotransferase accessory factor
VTSRRDALPTATRAGDRVDASKRYTFGTHRVCSPEVTLTRVQPLLDYMGITRIANVTGLDRIGLPVVMVIRPNARSGAVSQGKGLTLAAAKASGLMEAAELWHAENIVRPRMFASFEEMNRIHRVADPDLLPRAAGGDYEPNRPLYWIEGRDLLSKGAVWVPLELVSTDYTLPLLPGSGYFQATTNGLAAGNHPLEAICHGLCEVLERDAATLWWLSGDGREGRAIDPSSVTDPECRRLLDHLATVDLAVRIWNTTSDAGVASFCCLVSEKDGSDFADPEYGNGCHPNREVALLRALTEAAQARATYISGSREDFPVDAWEPSYRGGRLDRLGCDLDAAPFVSFDSVPSYTTASLNDDLDHLLARIRAIGIDQVIAVDLSQEALGIPVMRIVVPGLEGQNDVGSGYTRGVRARRLTGSVR